MRIEKSELIKKIGLLEKVIPTKPVISCMEGILVKDGRMCANDLQNAISIEVPEAGDESFIIPRKAIAMAKNLPDGMIEILPDVNCSLLIRAGKIRTKMSTFAPDDFPKNFDIEEATETTMDFGELCDMLNSVAYATSTSEARPVHTGVLLDGDGTELNAVACDGFRCAWAHTAYTEEFKMILPKTTVKMLLSIKEEGKIGIQMKNEKAVFTVGKCKIYSRLLIGDFLSYKKIYPRWDKSVGIDRMHLLEAMRRISICSDDSHKGRVEMDGTETNLQLRTNGSSAEYVENLEVKDSFQNELRIMFNYAYFIDALKSYNCTVIDCFFGSKNTDALVMDDGYLKSLILPVRAPAKKND